MYTCLSARNTPTHLYAVHTHVHIHINTHLSNAVYHKCLLARTVHTHSIMGKMKNNKRRSSTLLHVTSHWFTILKSFPPFSNQTSRERGKKKIWDLKDFFQPKMRANLHTRIKTLHFQSNHDELPQQAPNPPYLFKTSSDFTGDTTINNSGEVTEAFVKQYKGMHR